MLPTRDQVISYDERCEARNSRAFGSSVGFTEAVLNSHGMLGFEEGVAEIEFGLTVGTLYPLASANIRRSALFPGYKTATQSPAGLYRNGGDGRSTEYVTLPLRRMLPVPRGLSHNHTSTSALW